MNLIRTSLIGGLCLSSLHFFWVIFVAIGWAQPLLDLVLMLHMLNSPFQVQPFNLLFAIGLIGVTFLAGCFYGAMLYLFRASFSVQSEKS